MSTEEHYYDGLSKRGFIEYRLWTLRKNLSPENKKYKDRTKIIAKSKQGLFSKNKLQLLSDDELNEKISWIKCKNSTTSNKTAIISCLKETLANRRNWITQKGPTIPEIFEKYPRLLDYKGEMIDMEFENMFEAVTNNFLAKFPSYYSPRILAYSSLHRPELYKLMSNIDNEHLRALVVLVPLLPVTNAQRTRKGVSQANTKGKKKQQVNDAEAEVPDRLDLGHVGKSMQEIPNKHLIQVIREGENLPQFVENFRKQYNMNVQPYIICVRGHRNETFFIQGDGWFCSVHDKSNPIVAFDLLFKVYYILNVSYPTSLKNFYNFMECYGYNIGSQSQGLVSSVHTNISNAKPKTTANGTDDDSDIE